MNLGVSQQRSVADRTRRRVNRRLMPFLFILYIVANLDRANVGFAGLRMSRELGFSDEVFGFGGGVFFLGYFLLEIPGTVLVEVWSARKWIARIMLTWGFLASATGWIHSAQQYYWIRFFLGVAEAGFFPGLVVYLSHWYRPEDRGRAVAMFMAAIPASQVVGAPLAAVLLRVHWWGYDGWRWLLTLEGLPAIVLGLITLFYLTDRPEQANWLKSDEREWLAGELRREREARPRYSSWKALRNPRVLLLAAILLLGLAPNYGLSLWLPQMVQRLSTFGVSQVSLIAAIPYLCSLPLMLLTGWHSDRTGERKWHTAIPRLISGAALTVCFFASEHIWITVLMLSLATVGFYCAHPGFWPLPNLFLGRAAAAASIGLINSFGNLGGFLGPYAIGFLSSRTGGFGWSLLLLSACAYASGLMVLRVRLAPIRGAAERALRT
ncbi:MAG: MFS transporter [Terriglobia bacterium]|nr:MAG: MFS transporter [Terriglobia bacterium]